MIEVLVSLAIFSALAVLLLGTVAQVTRTQKNSESQLETLSMTRQALDRVLQDVSQAYLSKNQVDFQTQTASTFFEASPKEAIDEVRFSYMGHVSYDKDAKEADTGIVRYYGQPDNDEQQGFFQLIREEKPRIQKDYSVDKSITVIPVCQRVVKFELRYRRVNTSSSKEWVDTWSTQGATGKSFTLPYRVSARLVVALPKTNNFTNTKPETIELSSETTVYMQQPIDSSVN